MSNDDFTPPRGEAAWNVAKREVAKRNEAAYKKGREDRATPDAAVLARQLAAERRGTRTPTAQRSPASKRSGPRVSEASTPASRRRLAMAAASCASARERASVASRRRPSAPVASGVAPLDPG